MAWAQLDINRPHLVYIILGGFTSLFMLCSSVIKERLYIGEATVATIVGVIFGPHAADLINPMTWGNTDQVTLEFSRIVLVVQCFAVGVELPKAYMERHWRSVTFLLVPVMTFGWLVTSLFIWWMFLGKLSWLDSLCCAACVTATDPVLASSVVGKGKFAKRVPKHLRDLLSAESGCNDGMAFPFIYLALYLIKYQGASNIAGEVTFHWICYTVLYECIFGAFYGVCVGYAARRAIRFAHEKDLIDRESFLVFYFVLALFCAGSGSMLGMDDLLIGFACGVGFSNDGWFQEKTEESHVSNVIDLLINLAFFVYLGTIIPWEQYNSAVIGTSPWRLVVIAIFVILFRRIPIMVALKPVIPDIKTWREAFFAGHFGPIGVGAIFVAIMARAQLETDTTTPLAVLPPPGFDHLNIIELIWPITTFLVICSILVHGSSVAVFTLGKHINTLTLTLSYTQAVEDGPSWMDRLPRIQSRSKSSMSRQSSFEEKIQESGLSGLPISIPGNFLRRQREEDGTPSHSRSSSLQPRFRRSRKWDTGIGPGGPVSKSAISPLSRSYSAGDLAEVPDTAPTDSDTLAVASEEVSPETSIDKEKGTKIVEPEEEVYQEGDRTIIEDEEGNVLEVTESKKESTEERRREAKAEGRRLMEERNVERGEAQTGHDEQYDEGTKMAEAIADPPQQPSARPHLSGMRKAMESFGGLRRREDAGPSKSKPEERTRGPALAYQFGNTIIVEDEDGEVLKKYDIPSTQKKSQRPGADRMQSLSPGGEKTRERLQKMGQYLGMGNLGLSSDKKQQEIESQPGPSVAEEAENKYSLTRKRTKQEQLQEEDDKNIRFTISAGGRRMSKAEFIEQIQRMDPKSRARMVEDSDAPEAVKREARLDARESNLSPLREQTSRPSGPFRTETSEAQVQRPETHGDSPRGPDGLTLVTSNEDEIPFHPVSDDLARFQFGGAGRETAAQRRRRLAANAPEEPAPTDVEQEALGERSGRPTGARQRSNSQTSTYEDEPETAAERRRRQAALGMMRDENSESSSDEEDGMGFREPPRPRSARPRSPEIERLQEPAPTAERQGRTSIRFADLPESPRVSPGPRPGGRLRWGGNVGREKSGR